MTCAGDTAQHAADENFQFVESDVLRCRKEVGVVLKAIVLMSAAIGLSAAHAKEPPAIRLIKLFRSSEPGCAGRGEAFKIRNVSNSRTIKATLLNSNGVPEDFTLAPRETDFVSCAQWQQDLSAIHYAVTKASYVGGPRRPRRRN